MRKLRKLRKTNSRFCESDFGDNQVTVHFEDGDSYVLKPSEMFMDIPPSGYIKNTDVYGKNCKYKYWELECNGEFRTVAEHEAECDMYDDDQIAFYVLQTDTVADILEPVFGVKIEDVYPGTKKKPTGKRRISESNEDGIYIRVDSPDGGGAMWFNQDSGDSWLNWKRYSYDMADALTVLCDDYGEGDYTLGTSFPSLKIAKRWASTARGLAHDMGFTRPRSSFWTYKNGVLTKV